MKTSTLQYLHDPRDVVVVRAGEHSPNATDALGPAFVSIERDPINAREWLGYKEDRFNPDAPKAATLTFHTRGDFLRFYANLTEAAREAGFLSAHTVRVIDQGLDFCNDDPSDNTAIGTPAFESFARTINGANKGRA